MDFCQWLEVSEEEFFKRHYTGFIQWAAGKPLQS
jgi:hypothetical protein